MSTEQTLLIGFSCLFHCVVELIADSSNIPVSLGFRGAIWSIVMGNIGFTYMDAGFAVPSKVKYTVAGFAAYLAFSLIRLLPIWLPEILADMALCQYYLMTLLAFVIHMFFGEIYNEVGAEKFAYSREKVSEEDEEAHVHVYTAVKKERHESYTALDKEFITGFSEFMTISMRRLYFALLREKLVQANRSWKLNKTLIVI